MSVPSVDSYSDSDSDLVVHVSVVGSDLVVYVAVPSLDSDSDLVVPSLQLLILGYKLLMTSEKSLKRVGKGVYPNELFCLLF
ncbi:hypothetical protein PR003_g1821 [Phytophthora rubi]|uniref:Uncharacterized protein n=1 Tax=Phytophthora rubi TaxID=129364 RepID=A0A6A4G842_9STRA|nr:hypothetical protein PR003_g1821 [Phytophthora rubi]